MLRSVANPASSVRAARGVIVGDVNFRVAQQRQWRVGHQRHHDPLHLGQGRRPPQPRRRACGVARRRPTCCPLSNFTLQNAHVRTSTYDNQAGSDHFNTGTAANAARMVAKQMNFLSEQDTLQLKGAMSGSISRSWPAMWTHLGQCDGGPV